MTLERFLYGTLLTTLFAVPFIPLVVADTMYFPFIVGKNFTFRILVEVAATIWLALFLFGKTELRGKGPVLWAVLAFTAVMGLATVTSIDPYRSFWSNYERMEGYVTILHLLAYFVVMASVMGVGKRFERFFQTGLFVSVLLGFYGLMQLNGLAEIHQGGVRLDATLGNATYLAVLMLFNIFLCAYFMVRAGSGMRLVYGAIGALALFMLYNTATRGAILGLLGGIVIASMTAMWLMRDNPRMRRFALGALLAMALFVGGFIAIKDSAFVQGSPVLSRFAGISLGGGETPARFVIWNMALKGVAENPILGIGQDNFTVVFSKFYEARLYNQEPFFDRAHNVFLDWLTAGGLLGLLSYLSIFAAALLLLYRASEKVFSPVEKSILVGLLAAYFGNNLFVFDNITSYIMFFAVVGFIASRADDTSFRLTKQQLSKETLPMRSAAIALLVIALPLIFYTVNVKGISAGKMLIKAMSPQEKGPAENLRYFEKAVALDSFGTPEISEQFLTYADGIKNAQQVPQDLRIQFMSRAEEVFQKLIAARPYETRYEIFYGSYLGRRGATGEAIKHLTRGHELSPGKQGIILELASVYVARREHASALLWAKKAFELEPRNAEARVVYAIVATYAKRDDIARELLNDPEFLKRNYPQGIGAHQSGYDKFLMDDDRFVSALTDRGDVSLAIELIKKRIAYQRAAGQDDPRHHIALAAAYINTGQRALAIEELRRVSVLDPKLKDQMEYYIREIEAGRNP